MTTDIITTHFDYHSIDHNLLKLDILGHDDPTMIKTLEELINSDAMDNEYDGVNNVFKATDIPLDDPGCNVTFCRNRGAWYHAGGHWRMSAWLSWEFRSLVQILLSRW